jgi:hypothetical protein
VVTKVYSLLETLSLSRTHVILSYLRIVGHDYGKKVDSLRSKETIVALLGFDGVAHLECAAPLSHCSRRLLPLNSKVITVLELRAQLSTNKDEV